MQKRHFEMIARTIKARMDQGNSAPAMAWRKAALEEIARDFADELEQQNDRFDRDRFLTACGVEDYGNGVLRRVKPGVDVNKFGQPDNAL